MRRLAACGIAIVCLSIAGSAIADAPSTIPAASGYALDLSQVVNDGLDLLFAAVAGVAVAALRRGVALLETMHLISAAQFHSATLDDFVTQAAAWAEAQLEAIVDPAVKVRVQSAVLAQAAQIAADQAPAAMAALGLTTAGIRARIEVALSGAAPQPTVAAPGPGPAPGQSPAPAAGVAA